MPCKPFHPSTDSEKDLVRNQLHKVLTSPVFQNSRRYTAVLKFIVEQTLQGNGGVLKERTIGIEVFQRAPDYDTATDHVVRSAASEVRKRLAQYYQQCSQGELRIEVLSGSYVPQFRLDDDCPAATPCLPDSVAEDPGQAAAPAVGGEVTRGIWRRRKWIVMAATALVAVLVLLIASRRPSDPFDAFWGPVFSSPAPVLLCIGNLAGGQGSPAKDSGPAPTLSLQDFHNSPNETVNLYDAMTLAKFAGLMQANGKRIALVSQSAVTYDDLQTGPAIMVGLLNNGWTKSLLPSLRFVVERPAPGIAQIRDRDNPANTNWSVNFNMPYLDVNRDYAIVLRMVDPKTEQTVIAAAGLTVYGTTAAGNFLTSRSEMKKLEAIAPPGWKTKNMELVLSTDVIHGQTGPANIVAAQFW